MLKEVNITWKYGYFMTNFGKLRTIVIHEFGMSSSYNVCEWLLVMSHLIVAHCMRFDAWSYSPFHLKQNRQDRFFILNIVCLFVTNLRSFIIFFLYSFSWFVIIDSTWIVQRIGTGSVCTKRFLWCIWRKIFEFPKAKLNAFWSITKLHTYVDICLVWSRSEETGSCPDSKWIYNNQHW